MGSESKGVRTVREIGGEIWGELYSTIGEDRLDLQTRNQVIDLIMGVLARHVGTTIENDPDLPVEPLQVRFGENQG